MVSFLLRKPHRIIADLEKKINMTNGFIFSYLRDDFPMHKINIYALYHMSHLTFLKLNSNQCMRKTKSKTSVAQDNTIH
jgi:hypothetical protein